MEQIKNKNKEKFKNKEKNSSNDEDDNSSDENEIKNEKKDDNNEIDIYPKHKHDDKADFFFSDKKFSEMKLTPLTVECLKKQGFIISNPDCQKRKRYNVHR